MFFLNYVGVVQNKYRKHVYTCLLHLHVVPNCMHFFLLWEKKKEVILENAGNQTFSIPIDFYYMFCLYNGSKWKPKQFGHQHSALHIYLLMNKDIQVWNVNNDRIVLFGGLSHFEISLVADCNVHIIQSNPVSL